MRLRARRRNVMTGITATCWKCGAPQHDLLLPLSRTDECSQCGVDLHVCRMCALYDTSRSNACREPIAELVSDKTRANFCGYLELQNWTIAKTVAGDEGTDRDALTTLFGLPSSAVPNHDPATVLRDLFQLDNDSDTSSKGD